MLSDLKIIRSSDLDRIGQLLEGHGLTHELKALEIKVVNYYDDDFSVSALFDDVRHNDLLKCNCLARGDYGIDANYHSSECACYYEDSPEGIAHYERHTGQRYVG